MRSQALSSAEGRKGYSEATAGFMQSGTTAIKVGYSIPHDFLWLLTVLAIHSGLWQ